MRRVLYFSKTAYYLLICSFLVLFCACSKILLQRGAEETLAEEETQWISYSIKRYLRKQFKTIDIQPIYKYAENTISSAFYLIALAHQLYSNGTYMH